MSSLGSYFYLYFYLSQWARVLPLKSRVYLRHCTRISLSLFMFECVFQCLNILSFIVGVYVRLLICVTVSLFLWLFIFVFGNIVTDCTYIGTSLIPRFCLSFPLSFSVSGYIIDNFHVCEQARSCRSVYSCALENLCIIINSACIRTSTDSYFYLSLWLWMFVPVSGYVITDCMCIYVSWSCLFLSFSLEICSSVRLYCHWL